MNIMKSAKSLQLPMIVTIVGNLFLITDGQAGEYEQRVTADCIAKGGDEKAIAACITGKLTEAASSLYGA